MSTNSITTENAGASVATVTLSSTPSSDAVITLSYEGTATSGSDYTASTNSITIETSSTTDYSSSTATSGTDFSGATGIVVSEGITRV